eukprot:1146805-Pelagomonas_calceolata.AAC.11
MNHQQAGIICRSNAILSTRPFQVPGLSNCVSMGVPIQLVPSGAVQWAWGCQAGTKSTPSWLPNIKLIPDNIARSNTQLPKLGFPGKRFRLASMPSFRAGGALARPCWPSSA